MSQHHRITVGTRDGAVQNKVFCARFCSLYVKKNVHQDDEQVVRHSGFLSNTSRHNDGAVARQPLDIIPSIA